MAKGDRCRAPLRWTFGGRKIAAGTLGTVKDVRPGELLILWDEVSTESAEVARTLSQPFWMPDVAVEPVKP